MKFLTSVVIWVLIVNTVFGAKITVKKWEKGKTFSEYIQAHQMGSNILESISKEDLKFLSEIHENQEFYELRDTDGMIEQVLIPIGQEMQIHLAKNPIDAHYLFDIIPIVYKEKTYYGSVTIESNPHSDITKTIHLPVLADKIGKVLKGTINTKKLKKGDTLNFIYVQKTRMGKPYYAPHVKIAMLKSKKKQKFIYTDNEGYGYTSETRPEAYKVKGKKKVTYTRKVKINSKSARFGMPLRHARITSSFSRSRYHPILKRYRPHHGTDFGAKRGTPLLAVNAGKVIFSGRMGGYGNVVKIKHGGGYVSLYAHQSRRRVKKGQWVKKGQIIGYVGSTGRSTGPHLHFGLMKNGKWVNPMRVLRKKSIGGMVLKKFTKYENTTTTKYKKVSIKGAKENRKKLLSYVVTEKKPYIWDKEIQLCMKVENENHHSKF